MNLGPYLELVKQTCGMSYICQITFDRRTYDIDSITITLEFKFSVIIHRRRVKIFTAQCNVKPFKPLHHH